MFLLKWGYIKISYLYFLHPFPDSFHLTPPTLLTIKLITSLSLTVVTYIWVYSRTHTHTAHIHTHIHSRVQFCWLLYRWFQEWQFCIEQLKKSASFMGKTISPFPSCSQLPIILFPVFGPHKAFPLSL